jgi:hypothetical protein
MCARGNPAEARRGRSTHESRSIDEKYAQGAETPPAPSMSLLAAFVKISEKSALTTQH